MRILKIDFNFLVFTDEPGLCESVFKCHPEDDKRVCFGTDPATKEEKCPNCFLGYEIGSDGKCVRRDPCLDKTSKLMCLRVGKDGNTRKEYCPRGFEPDDAGDTCVANSGIVPGSCPPFFSKKKGCQHTCDLSLKSTGEYITNCKCYDGFTLDADGMSCKPIDSRLPCSKTCSGGICVFETQKVTKEGLTETSSIPSEDVTETSSVPSEDESVMKEVCKCTPGYVLLDEDKCVKYCDVSDWKPERDCKGFNDTDGCNNKIKEITLEIQAFCGKGISKCLDSGNTVKCGSCPISHVMTEENFCSMKDPCDPNGDEKHPGEGVMCLRKPFISTGKDEIYFPYAPGFTITCKPGFTMEPFGVGFKCVEQCLADENQKRCELRSQKCKRRFSQLEPECVCHIPGYNSILDKTDNKYKCFPPKEPVQISDVEFSILRDDYVSLNTDGKILEVTSKAADPGNLEEQEKNCQYAPDPPACIKFVNLAKRQLTFEYMEPEAQNEVITDTMLMQLRKVIKHVLKIAPDAPEALPDDVSIIKSSRTQNLVKASIVFDKSAVTEKGEVHQVLKSACKQVDGHAKDEVCLLGDSNRVLVHKINSLVSKTYDPCGEVDCKCT